MAEKIKRTSKFVGKTFEGWKVVDIFVDTVQGKKCTMKKVVNAKGNLVLATAKRPGHQTYIYMLQRQTSDGKCEKRIALNATQMRKVARGQLSAEYLADNYFTKTHTDYRFN